MSLSSSSAFVSPLGQTNKPLIILQSRDFKNEEKKMLFKWFNAITEVNEITKSKKITDFTKNDLIICDIRSSMGRDWWGFNSKYVDATVDNIVWCRAQGDELKDEEFQNSIRFENKRLPEIADVGSLQDLLHYLLQPLTVKKVLTSKKKFLKKLLCCLCSALK